MGREISKQAINEFKDCLENALGKRIRAYLQHGRVLWN